MLAESKAPSTLWATYSMLSAGHLQHHGCGLKETYPQLRARLKVLSKNYSTKKAKTFSRSDVVRFMNMPVDDVQQVQDRALLALSWFGGLRCGEMRMIKLEDVMPISTDTGVAEGFRVTYRGLKTEANIADRTFIVPELFQNANIFAASLRAHIEAMKNSGFTEGPLARHKHSKKNKFVDQVVGKNSFYDLPKRIASALGLEPKLYTGHSLRRSSALAADSGATTFQLRRHYGWRNESTPQRYVDNSNQHQQTMANLLAGPTQVTGQVTQATQVVSSQNMVVPGQNTQIQSQVPSSNRITIDINLNIRQ